MVEDGYRYSTGDLGAFVVDEELAAMNAGEVRAVSREREDGLVGTIGRLDREGGVVHEIASSIRLKREIVSKPAMQKLRAVTCRVAVSAGAGRTTFRWA
ncbi:MAG TPA: hypothetical protein VGL61_17590 [Kofleriaceae bacterium]